MDARTHFLLLLPVAVMMHDVYRDSGIILRWDYVRGMDGVANAIVLVPQFNLWPAILATGLYCGGIACILAAIRMRNKKLQNKPSDAIL